MKVRDLGQAILDFELNNIPKFVFAALSLVFVLILRVTLYLIYLYDKLNGYIIAATMLGLLGSVEKGHCTSTYCYGYINLPYNFIIHQEMLIVVGLILGSIVLAYWLNCKLAPLRVKLQGRLSNENES